MLRTFSFEVHKDSSESTGGTGIPFLNQFRQRPSEELPQAPTCDLAC